MMRYLLRWALITVLLIGLAPIHSDAQQQGAVLRLPGGGYWGHPSPFGLSRGPGYMRASLIFDTLVWRDASGETIPWLAMDWRVSDDELTWTFTLRDNVRWHDGEPFTADDVVFSYQYYLDHPGTAWFFAQVNVIASVEATSDTEVVITLNQPYAPFLQLTAEPLLIFPRHIWEGVEDVRGYVEPDAFTGTGAYRLVEYSVAEASYLFEANPDFFLGDPYVQSLAFVPTSDNILALLNGDIGAFDQFGGVTPEMLAPFQQEPFAVEIAPGEWGMFLHFNLEADTPLQDLRVRQAIAHAIDRQALLDRVLFGFGSVGSMGILPPANAYHADGLPDYRYEPDAARALLADAGYDGTPIKLSYATNWIMFSPRTIEIVENGLREIGLNIETVVTDLPTLDAAAVEGDYEIGLFGYGGMGADPDLLRRNFSTNSPMRGVNRALGYSNPEFDARAVEQLNLTDPAERQTAVEMMQVILAQDLPVIPLYYTDRVVVYNAAVFDNWYFTPGGFGGGVPMPYNKHQFITGEETGLVIR